MRRAAERKTGIRKIRSDTRKLCGARKVRPAPKRDGVDAARCTVARPMREMGLRGAVRGRKAIPTKPDASRPCPDDKLDREVRAERPNRLRVSDVTDAPTWSGTVRVAFVIDAFAGRILGWRVSTSMTPRFVPDAPEQATWQRKPPGHRSLTQGSDRGSQHLSITCTERPADADGDPSAGRVGDSRDDALAEGVIGLFRTEVIQQLGPRKTMQHVARETMHRVDRYTTERLPGSIGYIPPAEAERRYPDRLPPTAKVA